MAVTAQRATRREWIGLAVIALPCLLYSMDLTVLNLAVPAISADLQPSATQLLWIIDIYGFSVAGFLITMGTLGDRIGRRRLLMIGGAAFGAASVIAAFSHSPSMLIAMRAVLGIAGATLAPSTLSLIRNMFNDPQQRTFAIGVWVASYSAGAAVGPVVGGVLLHYFWWGSVFLVSVPVMVLLLVVGPVLLPEYRDPDAGQIDLLSALLSLVAVLATIYGIKQIAEHGLGVLPVLAIVTGLLVGWIFVRRQARLTNPLVDLRLFRYRSFTAALVTYTISTFIAFGIYIFIAQHMQLVMGMDPLEAGLWTVPFALAFVAGSLLTPLAARKVKPAYLVGGGFVVSAAGFVLLAQVDASSGVALLLTAFIVYSIGLSPVVTLATDLIVGCVPAERAGSAGALSETGSELGGALGIAILGSIGTAIYRRELADAPLPGIAPDVLEAARSTLGAALVVAQQLGGDLQAALIYVSRAAFVEGLQVSALISAGLAVVSAIIAVAALGRESASDDHMSSL